MSVMTTLVRCTCGAWKHGRGSRHACPGVPSSVAAMHATQRNTEPPKPWTVALRGRGVEAAASQTGTEPPKPYTLALARLAAEGR
jgi:hypothetical protein